ncbi:MAG: LysR family transcriptional regulator [Caulobacteraceae bacterium]|nr:LysR family transcriptional regulator [Caulobacteraceae bacterium]
MMRESGDRAHEMAVFSRVLTEGSFSAAARSLGLAPSAVSRIIARLEARLGVRLLVRTTRALAPTPEGEAYHRAAARILDDIDDLEQTLADQASPRGRLRVSATVAHGRMHILPLLPDFLALYPGILVDISLTDAVVDLVEERADVAIRVGLLPDSPLMARKLGESGRTVVASPAYLACRGTPGAPEDLLSHNCIGFNFRRAQRGWPFVRDGVPFELAVRGNVEANNGDTVRRLAIDGVGVARVGTFHIAQDMAEGRLVPLLEDFNPGDREPFHALYIGGRTAPKRVRVFLDFLTERLR